MASFSRLKEPWKSTLAAHSSSLRDEFPDYYASDPESLVCTSRIHSFQLGTGASIYTQSLLPAILEAKSEIILVTCFWASSSTLSALREALEQLAEHRREYIRNQCAAGLDVDVLSPLRVRVCFSSRSLLQKLLHTSSNDGYVYSPTSWHTKLGLPDQETLHSGLIDLRVKSLFFLPFSVMHPKFLIVDRQRAWLPSCNVSWEAWLEGCVEISGEAVVSLMEFYRHVWDRQLDGEITGLAGQSHVSAAPSTSSVGRLGLTSIRSPATLFVSLTEVTTPTILLPSPHHRNPRFDLNPWHSSPSPPLTPLNCAIIRLLNMARSSIYLQTPNLTSASVIDGLLEALKRGVDVTIVTSKGMMLLEQIVTAGTTTSLCLRSLIRKYQVYKAHRKRNTSNLSRGDSGPVVDLEAQMPHLGSLKVSYFRPCSANRVAGVPEEPVHSHLKLTIIDGQFTVLGSGNMDRASWFTSQELGILFESTEFATAVNEALGKILDGRLNLIFPSSKGPKLRG
ncbi:hypothetical protein F4779DRAFT_318058 [Xylariaceae sp. FL0662B]|nr:hypothetical protein F4779DRAFT_318058 [Xylariaceae sp. FL0662B]